MTREDLEKLAEAVLDLPYIDHMKMVLSSTAVPKPIQDKIIWELEIDEALKAGWNPRRMRGHKP